MPSKLNAVSLKGMATLGRHGDGDGLWFQVQSAASRSWLFRFTSPLTGRVREMGLGAYPAVSLAEARESAFEARRKVRAGVDPLDARKRVPAAPMEAAAGLTVRAAASAYIVAKKAGWRNEKHGLQWTNTLSTYVYPLVGDKLARDVTSRDVLEILEPIWAIKSTTASRVRERLECVLDFARVKEGGWADQRNPAVWRGNLAMLLPKPTSVHKVTHHAALPYGEAPAFWSSLKKRSGCAAQALRLLILTAVRSKPVRFATWAEMNLEEAVWTIPASHMKRGHAFTVPLVPSAIAVLRSVMPLRNPSHGNLVFPGLRIGHPMSENTMAAVLGRMGIESSTATVHGFRSAFRDWVATSTNHQPDVAEMALDHALAGGNVRAAYQRSEMLDKRRLLMADWAKFLGDP